MDIPVWLIPLLYFWVYYITKGAIDSYLEEEPEPQRKLDDFLV